MRQSLFNTCIPFAKIRFRNFKTLKLKISKSNLRLLRICFSLLKDLSIQNLFMFTAAGAVPCGGRKTYKRD